MKPQLIPEWKRVVRRAWSVRLMGAAIVCSGIEAGLPYLNGVLPIPQGTFALMSFAATCAATAARLIAQRSMQDD